MLIRLHTRAYVDPTKGVAGDFAELISLSGSEPLYTVKLTLSSGAVVHGNRSLRRPGVMLAVAKVAQAINDALVVEDEGDGVLSGVIVRQPEYGDVALRSVRPAEEEVAS